MSQVDYVHFFSNILWSFLFLCILYLLISIFYIQNFYKLFRLRNEVLKNIFLFLKNIEIILLFIFFFPSFFSLNYKNFNIKIFNFNNSFKNYYKNLCI